MRLFENLGRVKSRSMFGGFGIFVDDTMFALVVNDKLHIRADDNCSEKYKQQGLEPYVYKNVVSQWLLNTLLFQTTSGKPQKNPERSKRSFGYC